MHGRLWCGKMIYSRGNLPLGFQCPIPSTPPWKKSNPVLSEATAKASVQSFCFILKLSPLEPTPSAVGPDSCQVHVVPRSQARESVQMQGASASPGRQEKRDSLLPWDYITLGLGWTMCFFKRTNQLPKLSQAFWWVHSLVRLEASVVKHLTHALQQSSTREGEGGVSIPLAMQCYDPL